MPSIHFYSEDVDFKIRHALKLKQWIKSSIEKEKYSLKSLSYIFCSDQALLQRNIQFLNHNTLTDIITFDLAEQKGFIEGEIYISVERVKENALQYSKTFENELHRVMIHGVLHLVGYHDKKSTQKVEMRKREDFYLRKLSTLLAKPQVIGKP
jgi:probable rRNA maturation factor